MGVRLAPECSEVRQRASDTKRKVNLRDDSEGINVAITVHVLKTTR